MQVLLSANGYFVMLSNGVFARQSEWLGSWMLISFYFIYHVDLTWVPAQFVYRCVFTGVAIKYDITRRIMWV